ncbi:Bna3p [Sugiyamaella lignohabitans]|uniref:Bna3p n=1 Tax=Sugiyamaella lignohabitans TaxID=796027 RepID=A0A167E541_9ASCO|nr:Bna3p [Sugiyamaella lignohabitans]ANB13650.1 Bna3p [Sugiyamaella lignohabitans]
MVYQEDFGVERWMDAYETKVKLNISETCCASLSIEQLETILDKPFPVQNLLSKRLVYGDIPGSLDVRNTIAELYNETSIGDIKINADDILATNGAIGANFLLYYSLVGPGDHVICVDPVYQQLKSVPAVFGGEVELLKLRQENDFLPDLDELHKMVRPGKTKIININSPHNPSGSVISDPLLKKIVDIAREAGAYLICDEVYRPLFHSLPKGVEAPSSVVSLYEKGISTGSTSKAFALAGLRFGWIVTSDKSVITECMKRRDYSTISVSMIDDIVATWALTGRHKLLEHNIQLCKTNLEIVDQFIKDCEGAVSWYRPQAGTTMFLKIHGVTNTEQFCKDFISEYSTLLVPGETFDSPGYVRIGFANATEDLKQGLDNLQKFIKTYRK